MQPRSESSCGICAWIVAHRAVISTEYTWSCYRARYAGSHPDSYSYSNYRMAALRTS